MVGMSILKSSSNANQTKTDKTQKEAKVDPVLSHPFNSWCRELGSLIWLIARLGLFQIIGTLNNLIECFVQ